MSDGMGREFVYLSSHATNRYFIPNWGRYYEVDNIFVYMVETYINGNFETFRRLYHELNKDARRDFMDFLLSEVEPTYWREILKQII